MDDRECEHEINLIREIGEGERVLGRKPGVNALAEICLGSTPP
jgi:hypothetical protein